MSKLEKDTGSLRLSQELKKRERGEKLWYESGNIQQESVLSSYAVGGSLHTVSGTRKY
jgi:hypothetical protein